MARPKKDPSEKSVKVSITIKPDLLPFLMHHCNKEDRSMAWVIDKALRVYLREKGEEI